MNTYVVYLADKTCVIIKAKSPSAAAKLASKKTKLPAVYAYNYGP